MEVAQDNLQLIRNNPEMFKRLIIVITDDEKDLKTEDTKQNVTRLLAIPKTDFKKQQYRQEKVMAFNREYFKRDIINIDQD